MALVDFSSLTESFDATDPLETNQVAVQAGPWGTSLTWVTAPSGSLNFAYTALSSLGNIVGAPANGTIDSISVAVKDGANPYVPAFTITGLSVPLSSLFSTTAANTHELFWETVMAGASTIILPSFGQVSIAGDFIEVESNQTGAADLFQGNNFNAVNGNLIGDAFTVLSGKTLIGGADVFDRAAAGLVIGDAYNVLGSLTGGADKFNYSYAFNVTLIHSLGLIVGDAYNVTSALPIGGKFTGGNDTFTINNVLSAPLIFGDAYVVSGAATAHGGNDTINLSFIANFGNPGSFGEIGGDVSLVSDVADGIGATLFDASGGNDVINIKNMNGNLVSGDFNTITFNAGQSALGGNDAITVSNTMVAFAPPPPYPPPLMAVTQITGDAVNVGSAAASAFRGGNDVIKINNVLATAVSGDVVNAGGTNLLLRGGNDTIIFNWTRPDIGNVGVIAGDAASFSGKTFFGGSDVITVNIPGTSAVSQIYGDLGSMSGPAGAAFVGGNDVITLNLGIALTGTFMVGDAGSASATSGSWTGGNDKLTGAGGNDTIFGDSAIPVTGFTTVVGGADILDGRGGNDTLDGGLGNDTAVFSLAQGVFVNLGGIIGTNPAVPGNPFEAIGQGFDQLVSIENVTGSSKNDFITGNGVFNILIGGLGNDTLDGGVDGVIKDNLFGGLGNDTYLLAHRMDNIFDSGGIDTVRSTISRDLSAPGFGAMENLVLQGTAANGTGNARNNSIFGNASANILTGNNGSDTLFGGDGADTMSGGRFNAAELVAARDTFVFNSITNSGTFVMTADTIKFFDKGGGATDDRISLTGIDANSALAGNQNFTFKGAGAFTLAGGEVRVVTVGADTHVQIDNDADAAMEMLIIVKGVTGLVAGDFFF